jgi:hypothetical protein
VNSPGLRSSNFNLRDLTENNNFTQESELGCRANFRLPFSILDGQKGLFKFGGRLRIKVKERTNNFIAYKPVTPFGNLGTLPAPYF